jgi:hypothetical protein
MENDDKGGENPFVLSEQHLAELYGIRPHSSYAIGRKLV